MWLCGGGGKGQLFNPYYPSWVEQGRQMRVPVNTDGTIYIMLRGRTTLLSILQSARCTLQIGKLSHRAEGSFVSSLTAYYVQSWA